MTTYIVLKNINQTILPVFVHCASFIRYSERDEQMGSTIIDFVLLGFQRDGPQKTRKLLLVTSIQARWNGLKVGWDIPIWWA